MRSGSAFRPVRCNDRQEPGPAASGRATEENRTMITAIVLYKLPPHIDLAACAAHYRSIAPGFRDVPGLIRKQVHLRRGPLGRRRLPVADAGRGRGLLHRAVAERHPRALRHGPADEVFRDSVHHRQCDRGDPAARSDQTARSPDAVRNPPVLDPKIRMKKAR